MYRILLEDKTFRELNIPLPLSDRKELEKKVRKYAQLPPIITWKGYILTGYELYELCRRCGRSPLVKEMDCQRKQEAVAWLCQRQLAREDLGWIPRAWLIYRLYEALREIAQREKAKDDFQYRQFSPSLYASDAEKPLMENVDILNRLGADFQCHRETIRRYVRFGRQLDCLEEKFPGTRSRILSGKLDVSMACMYSILKMPEDDLKKMLEDAHCTRHVPALPASVPASGKKEAGSESENNEAKPKVVFRLETGIKQMPEYDPDAELNGLAYTIGSWVKAILRTAIRADLNQATPEGKQRLAKALQELAARVQYLSRKLEGNEND